MLLFRIATLIVLSTFSMACSQQVDVRNQHDRGDLAIGAGIDVLHLHELKLGMANSVEESLLISLALDARIMYEQIANFELDDKKTKRTSEVLRLMSVMNEKFEIEEWRSDMQLLEIFRKMQEMDPEHTKNLRCRNWNKSMWVGEDECT